MKFNWKVLFKTAKAFNFRFSWEKLKLLPSKQTKYDNVPSHISLLLQTTTLSPQCCVFHSTCKSSSFSSSIGKTTTHCPPFKTQTWFSVKFHSLTSKFKSACRAEEPLIPPSIFLCSQLCSPRKIPSYTQTKLETDFELGRLSSTKTIKAGLA